MPVFGPVPSRRLGISLGVNNIPPKICTYACRYCQLGKTLHMSKEPLPYFAPRDLYREVEKIILEHEGTIDYLTVVPDGEPTLDRNLEELAMELRRFGIPLAIISNSSLIARREIRRALLHFDWVSLKVDAVSEGLWRRIDRPHPDLELSAIHEGMLRFRDEFQGLLNTETMLVSSINDSREELELIASFLGRLQPDTAWISLPLRPPAESDAAPADDEALQLGLRLFRAEVPIVEALNRPEGDEFSACGADLGQAILDITSVHPIRATALKALLARKGSAWDLVEKLVGDSLLLEREWQGEIFYRSNLERLPSKN